MAVINSRSEKSFLISRPALPIRGGLSTRQSQCDNIARVAKAEIIDIDDAEITRTISSRPPAA
jgi:hypothetical protein